MGCNEAWIPQSVTKCGLSVKDRSIQDEDWEERICAGTGVTWWRPNILVGESMWFPSRDLSMQFSCPVDSTKTQPSKWVFKLNLQKILFLSIFALTLHSKQISLLGFFYFKLYICPSDVKSPFFSGTFHPELPPGFCNDQVVERMAPHFTTKA